MDEKVAEAEFFLQRMAEVRTDMFGFKCYLSAYLSAGRTATLALQQFKHIPGFEEWYDPHRKALKESPIAKFFLDARNDHVHGGPHPVTSGRFHKDVVKYYFSEAVNEEDQPSSVDVVTLCREYLVLLLEVVHDCYVELGCHIDPQQYFTKEHFSKLGRSIDDAELEVWGWVMQSYIDEGYGEDDRWHELRGRVGECKINHLFYSYLGKPTPQPVLPEYLADLEYTPEDRGWDYVPVGFKSQDEYWAAFPDRRPAIAP